MNDKAKYYDNYFYFPLLLSGIVSASYIGPAIIFLNFKYALLSLATVWGIFSLFTQLKKSKQDRNTFFIVILINFLLILSYEHYDSEIILLTFLTSILWVGNIYLRFVREG